MFFYVLLCRICIRCANFRIVKFAGGNSNQNFIKFIPAKVSVRVIFLLYQLNICLDEDSINVCNFTVMIISLNSVDPIWKIKPRDWREGGFWNLIGESVYDFSCVNFQNFEDFFFVFILFQKSEKFWIIEINFKTLFNECICWNSPVFKNWVS